MYEYNLTSTPQASRVDHTKVSTQRVLDYLNRGDEALQVRRVFDSKSIYTTLQAAATPMTIIELADSLGIEVTPQLKRRLNWLTNRDQVLKQGTKGKGKAKVTTYTTR